MPTWGILLSGLPPHHLVPRGCVGSYCLSCLFQQDHGQRLWRSQGGSRRWGAGLGLCSADSHAELFPNRLGWTSPEPRPGLSSAGAAPHGLAIVHWADISGFLSPLGGGEEMCVFGLKREINL